MEMYNTQSPWVILFQCRGSIWSMVLPYCILNCLLVLVVALLKSTNMPVSFSPEGHAIMSLIISYLVVSKVNLAFERYMSARHHLGRALLDLRQLHQFAVTLTERETSDVSNMWRQEVKTQLFGLIDCLVRVLQDEKAAVQLARNEASGTNDDPLVLVQSLRSLIYHGSLALDTEVQLLERIRLADLLQEFTNMYQKLLTLASTPLPFALVQMGRTFLFLWVFTMPFVIVGTMGDLLSSMQFVFFLTYGFMGLEFVSMKLMHPFGDGANSLNISGMRMATIIGIEKDGRNFTERTFNRANRGSLNTFVPSTISSIDHSVSIKNGVTPNPSDETPYYAFQHCGKTHTANGKASQVDDIIDI